MTSHFESYLNIFQEKEISTKYLQYKRQKTFIDNKCRLYEIMNKDISNIIANYEQISSIHYLTMRPKAERPG